MIPSLASAVLEMIVVEFSLEVGPFVAFVMDVVPSLRKRQLLVYSESQALLLVALQMA